MGQGQVGGGTSTPAEDISCPSEAEMQAKKRGRGMLRPSSQVYIPFPFPLCIIVILLSHSHYVLLLFFLKSHVLAAITVRWPESLGHMSRHRVAVFSRDPESEGGGGDHLGGHQTQACTGHP